MRACLRFTALAVGILLACPRAGRAELVATGSWTTHGGASGFCVLLDFDVVTHDVFGTSVDFGTQVEHLFCTGSAVDGLNTGHCESRPDPGAFSADFSIPYTGVPGVYVPFVGTASNVLGTVASTLTVSSYTLDGAQMGLPGPVVLPTSTIPGCTVAGPVQVAVGFGGVNAFRTAATPAGANVVVAATSSYLNTSTGDIDTSSVGIEFSNVSAAGDTLVMATSSAAGAIPSNFSIDNGGFDPVFLDVTTTATFSGPITICSKYADEDDDGIVDTTGVPETALRFLHGEGGTFVDRTSSQDVVANRICAEVTSLSPFVIAVETTGSVTHDSVVWSAKPVKVMLGDGTANAPKKVAIKVQNADLGDSTARSVQLLVDHGTCPRGVLLDGANQPILPDFDPKTAGATDSIPLAGGRSKSASLSLQIRAADFDTPSAASPARCAIRFTTRGVGGTVIDPRPVNDTTQLELEVIDRNDY